MYESGIAVQAFHRLPWQSLQLLSMWPWCWHFTHCACFNEWNSFLCAAVEQSLTNKCYIRCLPSARQHKMTCLLTIILEAIVMCAEYVSRKPLMNFYSEEHLSHKLQFSESEKQKCQRKWRLSGYKTVQEMDRSVIISTAFCILAGVRGSVLSH